MKPDASQEPSPQDGEGVFARVQRGDQVVGLDRDGAAYDGRVVGIGPAAVVVHLRERRVRVGREREALSICIWRSSGAGIPGHMADGRGWFVRPTVPRTAGRL